MVCKFKLELIIKLKPLKYRAFLVKYFLRRLWFCCQTEDSQKLIRYEQFKLKSRLQNPQNLTSTIEMMVSAKAHRSNSEKTQPWKET
ncbi:MAG: hypothetical protein DCF12_16065 [Snowella sp.]|nr:MAG: hypothetical protein DCF12_16065 [Snowella sp.]